MRCLLIIIAMMPLVLPLEAAPKWKVFSHITKPDRAQHSHKVKTTAEQATLETATLEPQTRYGYSGPENIHTRSLRFACNATAYSVPDTFVSDLLQLDITEPTHASVEGADIVFSLHGSSGEKGYTVHFHFDPDGFSNAFSTIRSQVTFTSERMAPNPALHRKYTAHRYCYPIGYLR